MSAQQDDPIPGGLEHQRGERGTTFRIDAGERFVHHTQRRFALHRVGEADALKHALAEDARALLRGLPKANRGQPMARSFACLAFPHSICAGK